MKTANTTTIVLNTLILKQIIGSIDCMAMDFVDLTNPNSKNYVGEKNTEMMLCYAANLNMIRQFLAKSAGLPETHPKDSAAMAMYGKTVAELMVEQIES
jgi:hypothetical protein